MICDIDNKYDKNEYDSNGYNKYEMITYMRERIRLNDINFIKNLDRSFAHYIVEKDENGSSNLHYAVEMGNLDMVNEMISILSETRILDTIDVQDNDGNTPFMIAILTNHWQIADAILNDGNCDCIIQNNQGQTAYNIVELIQAEKNAEYIGLKENDIH